MIPRDCGPVRQGLFLLLFVVASGSIAFALDRSSRLLSQLAGQVGSEVITTRDVVINDWVDFVFLKAQKKDHKPLVAGYSGFEAKVTSLLLEWMVFLEAEVFSVSEVGKKEIEIECERVYQKLSGFHEWLLLEVSRERLCSAVERKLRAKKFIQFKSDSVAVPVTDQEVLTYYKRNQEKFGEMSFEKFKPHIKTYLQRAQAEKRLNDWFQFLKKKYQAQNLYQYQSVGSGS